MKTIEFKNITNKIINPLWSVGFFALAVILACFFHLPQSQVLIIICCYFTGIVIMHPVNGINFLLLSTPFFLGNSKRDYYIIFEIFVYTVIVVSICYFVLKEKENNRIFPYKNLVLLFFIISCLCLPLNFKEFYYEVKGGFFLHPTITLSSLFKHFCSSHEGKNIYWFRSLSNLFSGISIYFITAYYYQKENSITKNFLPIVIISIPIVLLGYLLLYDIIPHSGKFLTISLVGKHIVRARGITSIAYNKGYLAQYLILILPFIAFYMKKWVGNKLAFISASFWIIIIITSITYTVQRGAIIALFSQVGMFFFLIFYATDKKKELTFILPILLVLIMGLVVAIDYLFFHNYGFQRFMGSFHDLGRRGQQWKVAWEMFTNHPLLGVGFGKLHHFFPRYCKLAEVAYEPLSFYRSTAHNIYFHIIAERGILGLASFLLLIGVVFKDIFKSFKLLSPSKRSLLFVITVSLTGWLAYGMSQYMFYIRSMEMFFWIIMGFLTAILQPCLKEVVIPKKVYIISGIFFTALLIYRLLVINYYVI